MMEHVDVKRVIAVVRPAELWFLVELMPNVHDDRTDTVGMLAIATPSLAPDERDAHVVWELIDADFWTALLLDERGLPMTVHAIECPICTAGIDVRIPCTKSVDDVYAICPKCGWKIDDIGQHVIASTDDDEGGTAEL